MLTQTKSKVRSTSFNLNPAEKTKETKEKCPVILWPFVFLWYFVLCPIFSIIRIVIIPLIIFFMIIGLIFLALITPQLVDMYNDSVSVITQSTAADFKIDQSSVIYDRSGTKIATLKENKYSESLAYEDIPQDAINAFIAIEDRSFWSNYGFDVRGIARAAKGIVISKGEEVSGGSTITQQLVRNKYLSYEKTVPRKIKEILMSYQMAKKYSKKEIMEFYINNVNFSNATYGLQNAAKSYFNKNAKDLSLSEIAYLCAIPNRPSYYDPLKHPERALERRNLILQAMYDCGFITKPQMQQAMTIDIKVQTPDSDITYGYEATYAIKCAVEYLMKQSGFEFKYEFATDDEYKEYRKNYDSEFANMKHELYTGGYTIQTELNTVLTDSMQQIIDEKLRFEQSAESDTGVYKLQGAAICIDNVSRKVIACVGGRTQPGLDNMYTLNRSWQAFRQPGSTLKPIVVYTPALESGYTANSKIKNIDTKKAKTSTDPSKLSGSKYTIRYAVEQSLNGVAWLLLDEITPKKGLTVLPAMCFSRIVPSDYNDAAALGGLTYGVSVEEMAGAYSTLANSGYFVPPTCITSIKNSEGKEIYKKSTPVRVYTTDASNSMKDILEGVATKGTAKKLNWKDASSAKAYVKTGTTNDNLDGWFVGFTEDDASKGYTIAVWVGYDIPKKLDSLYGGSYPAEIWKECMLTALG